MFIIGSISFVLSLEEGFFAYQFRMLGWSLISLICIITGGTGWLFGLWGCRLWFIYPISALCVHNYVDYIVCRYCPFHTPLSLLKPQASWEGFISGIIATFIYFNAVSPFDH